MSTLIIKGDRQTGKTTLLVMTVKKMLSENKKFDIGFYVGVSHHLVYTKRLFTKEELKRIKFFTEGMIPCGASFEFLCMDDWRGTSKDFHEFWEPTVTSKKGLIYVVDIRGNIK